jgi:hypothetical protein
MCFFFVKNIICVCIHIDVYFFVKNIICVCLHDGSVCLYIYIGASHDSDYDMIDVYAYICRRIPRLRL